MEQVHTHPVPAASNAVFHMDFIVRPSFQVWWVSQGVSNSPSIPLSHVKDVTEEVKKHLKLGKVQYTSQDMSEKWTQSADPWEQLAGKYDHLTVYCLQLLNTKPSLAFSALMPVKTELQLILGSVDQVY